MTKSSDNLAKKALKKAEKRAKKARKALRRNTLAYIGLHGVAYEQAQDRIAQIRSARGDTFDALVEKGEKIEERAASLFTGAKSKANNIVAEGSEKVWDMMPGATVNRIEELEAELAEARKKLSKMTKKAKKKAKTTTKKSTDKAKAAAKKTVASAKKTTSGAASKAKAAAKPSAEKTKTATKTVAAPAKATPAAKKEPRHIPYFNDVKRYDPLASEDVVRKIVNHCGIALRSEDARYVACTDESERNTVRDSWLKKKLELNGSDADLDKKVLNVCSIMQRDNRKNRVTFYYLAAKAERKLDTL